METGNNYRYSILCKGINCSFKKTPLNYMVRRFKQNTYLYHHQAKLNLELYSGVF